MKYNFGLDAMNNPRKSFSGDTFTPPYFLSSLLSLFFLFHFLSCLPFLCLPYLSPMLPSFLLSISTNVFFPTNLSIFYDVSFFNFPRLFLSSLTSSLFLFFPFFFLRFFHSPQHLRVTKNYSYCIFAQQWTLKVPVHMVLETTVTVAILCIKDRYE